MRVIITARESVKYPRLMQDVDNPDRIVLFISCTGGTVIKGPVRTIGVHDNSWASADDPEKWQDFKGTIELSND